MLDSQGDTGRIKSKLLEINYLGSTLQSRTVKEVKFSAGSLKCEHIIFISELVINVPFYFHVKYNI